MDAAQKTLAEKWKPIQDDLAKLGMNYHAAWVDITEDLAAAVDYATKLYQALKQVPDWFANRIGGASIWTSITNATTTPEGRAASEASLGISSDPKEIGMVGANAKLKAALENYAAVTKAMREAQDISSKVRGDTSKNPGDDQNAEADAYTRATESIEKHIARLNADTQAVGLGAAAQAQLRAEAALTTAAMQAYGEVSTKTGAQIKDMAARVGEAAAAFEKAKTAAAIDFGRQTALLSPDDVQIAQALKGQFADVATSLDSTQAAALRMNQALSQTSSQISGDLTSGLTDIATGAKSAKDGFSDMASAILKDITRMIIQFQIVGPLMRGLQGIFTNGINVPGFNPIAGLTGHADGGLISGPGGPRSDNILARLSPGEFVMNAKATSKFGPLLAAMNGGQIPGFANGGFAMSPGGEAVGPECIGLPA
jgi:hypothetical protein